MTRNYFVAKYSNKCYRCGEPIEPGDRAFYGIMGERDPYGTCCDELSDEQLFLASWREAKTEEADDEFISANSVMPRRKTARDACTKCFQIPASNGVCGCV